MRRWLVCIGIFLFMANGAFPAVKLTDAHTPLTYNLPEYHKRPVIHVAAEMLDMDIEAVTGLRPHITDWEEARLRVCNLSTATGNRIEELHAAGLPLDSLIGQNDGFCLKASGGHLYAVGADDRGTAYALLEVSRLAGVSPWVWWNDVTPSHRDSITVADDYITLQTPSVTYRGIFINDEDWSLLPWSCMTFEPEAGQGTIGPRTYKEIFKLLLRLRANTIWPAMHDNTTPFYLTPGAMETADSCGIIIGTSHCEPMMRNNVGEWDTGERGRYNYITNRDAVLDYWAERVSKVSDRDNIYTVGMRGIHDGNMEGVKTMPEKVSALGNVINDQRRLLTEYVDPDIRKVPQTLVLYKEVLDIMHNGLEVPDDVTLMWCDDNYGHITQLSDPEQRKREGGSGVYYHLSYWGRPHDYLWLGTTQPGLIYREMKNAYYHDARRIWIVNVHDMKTSSYGMELFLDMAWDINTVTFTGVDNHLRRWLNREFGEEAAASLAGVMSEYYRLTAIRRPEHMGWTQVELSDRKAYPRGRSHVIDTDISFTAMGNEADRYMSQYEVIASRVDSIGSHIAPERRNAYFSQIAYPVKCAAAMSVKMLEAQRARSYAMGQSGESLFSRDSLMLGACARSIAAYRQLRCLTAYYNDSVAGGKWHRLTSMMPRDLPVFNPPVLPVGLTDREIEAYSSMPFKREYRKPDGMFRSFDATDYSGSSFSPVPIPLLGHSLGAIELPAGGSIDYSFDLPEETTVAITTALIPTQPVDGGDLRIAVSVDGNDPQIVSIREKGRSDRWKENVLRNQARPVTHHTLGEGRHTLTITAIDPNIILDQVMIDTDPARKYYIIP